MKYHVNGTTGEPGVCRAEKRACPHGDDTEHYETSEAARIAYEAKQTVFSLSHRKVKESYGVLLYRDIMDARKISRDLHTQRRTAGSAAQQDLLDSCTEARRRVRELEEKLSSLPWDSDDSGEYEDTPVDFVESAPQRSKTRRGYENDLDKLGPREHRIYEAMDKACEVWLSRLSTAEVKALHAYVQDAEAYARAVEAQDNLPEVEYLHSALRKAPRAKAPFIVYAGVSRARVNVVRDAAHNGEFFMDRAQSTSLNPAMVNSFMRPSEYDGSDHTALEIKTDRVASLSLFHLREEMEILLPPQDYKVAAVHRNISYAYADGYTYEPADTVYRLDAQ